MPVPGGNLRLKWSCLYAHAVGVAVPGRRQKIREGNTGLLMLLFLGGVEMNGSNDNGIVTSHSVES